MTREQAIKYGKDQLDIFGGMHREFLCIAIESLEKGERMKPFMRIKDFCTESGFSEVYVNRVIRAIPKVAFQLSDKPHSPYMIDTKEFLKAVRTGKAQRYVE